MPRIAVGAVQPHADYRPLFWALMDALRRRGIQVQTFFCQARFLRCDGTAPITGQCLRHLDTWLMSKETCRELFCHGARQSDLAVVQGTFGSAGCRRGSRGGSLDTLCSWLDLPRIAVIDVSRLDQCRLASAPAGVDAVLLDRVVNREHARRWQTTFEALWQVPVLGHLDQLSAMRAAMVRSLAEGPPSRQLCRALGDRLSASLDCRQLLRIAGRRAFPHVTPHLFCRKQRGRRLRVAVAYDEAFHYYFPDTLDLLEMRGATIQDFSPIHSERLPADTEVVYLGCGQAQHYADALAGNHCVKQALRNHVRNGGRIYAEGGGLAYLTQQMVLPDGRWFPMSGVLPLKASFNPTPKPTRPIELTLVRDNWLGRSSARLRGYLNSHWLIEPTSVPAGCRCGQRKPAMELVGRHQVIGSRLNLDFAAQPEFLESFFQPVPPPVPAPQAP